MSNSVPPFAFGNLNCYKNVRRHIPVVASIDGDGVLHLTAKNPEDEALLAKAIEDACAEYDEDAQ